MATSTASRPASDQTLEKKIQKARELYAKGPDVGKKALEALLKEMAANPSEPSGIKSAGRIGLRNGKISELTMIAPLAPGGKERLRALLDLRDGEFRDTDRVGTVHDMRFVFLDNDTKMMLTTSYDGEWDPYIADFVAKIPDGLDVLFSAWEGWPGIRSPECPDWIANHQIQAEGWYVAYPDLTVRDILRQQRVSKAVDAFLDQING